MAYPSRVTIVEVGLRDGLQNECTKIDTAQKLELLRDIADAGATAAEIGSFVRPDVMPQMADSGELMQSALQAGLGDRMELRALVPNLRGLQNAIASGCKNVKIGVSASRIHNMRNYNRTPEESIAAFEKVFRTAAENDVTVIGTLQMAFGSPWEGDIPIEHILPVVQIYDQYGIKKVGLGDTASMANPKKVYEVCSELRSHFPGIHFKTHFHNARGLGLSNVMAAMEAGITEFDGSFAGLGGCPFVPRAAGNIAMEDLLNMMNELGIETGMDIDKVIAIGNKVEQMVGHKGNSFVLRAGTSKALAEQLSKKQ